MICQDCGQQDATVVYTQIVSSGSEGLQKTVFHLCRMCAERREVGGLSIEIGMTTAPTQESPPPEDESLPEGPTCPQCGMTSREFRNGGRFGCKRCYSTFAGDLPDLMKHSHGDSMYRGKVPKRRRARISLTDRLSGLQDAMQEAIKAERFEEAAHLRDEIAAMKQEIDEEDLSIT
ncbi:MAG: UvrB/UvrC motif-containing protein [Candidatus Latescibacteria bacterium]|nr:UvrB/UvrC motif-containing protein [Candidatus Latescibacterota bacterium]